MTFPIPRAAFAQHTIALGKTRAGKSSKLRLIVENLLDHGEPVCVIDPKGDWWGLKSSADGKEAGYPVIIFGGEHADVPINEHSGAAVAELIATGNRPCIIDLGGWMVGARTRFFVEFASTLFKLTKGARHLVIDECHNFAPQGRVLDPDAGKMLHWANRLASEGAGKGVTLISASQRPQKVHKDYVTSHETLIACRVIHPLDRNAIKDWIDGCADPAVGKEVIGALAGLQRSQAYVWSPEIGFGPELVDFPLFSTYDSFKPQDARSPTALKGWASVNLDDVKTKLAKVVEEAKANDPRVLKAEIATLRKQMAEAVGRKIVADPNVGLKDREAAFAAGERQGYETGYARGWQDGDRAGFSSGVAAAHSVVKAALPDIASVNYVPGTAPKRIPAMAQTAVETSQSRARDPVQRAVTHAPAPVQRAGAVRSDTGLDGAQQRIVDGLRELESIGVRQAPRVLVAFMARYSHLNSKGFVNAIGALRSAGRVEYRPDSQVALTDAGREVANEPALALSTEAIHQRIVDILGGASGNILDPLIRAYPQSMTRADLVAAAGYGHANSKGFVNAIGRLRTLGFVDYPSTGEAVATAILFP